MQCPENCTVVHTALKTELGMPDWLFVIFLLGFDLHKSDISKKFYCPTMKLVENILGIFLKQIFQFSSKIACDFARKLQKSVEKKSQNFRNQFHCWGIKFRAETD